MANQLYSIEIRDQYGRLVAEIERPKNKQFSIYRNRPGSGQFTLDIFDPQATPDILQIGLYDVVFRRQGTPVFAGQLSYLDPIIDGDDKHVDVIATGYWDLFDQRYVSSAYPGWDATHNYLPFASTDVAQIAWSLVNDSQFPLYSDAKVQLSGSSAIFAQSFIAQGTANLTTLKLLLTNQSASGNLVVGLYTDNSGVPSGTLVANSQQTIAVSGISSSLSWYEIDYTGTLPALNNGQTYWIKAYVDTSQSGSNGIYWSYLNGDNYLAGKAYSQANPTFFSYDQDLQFFVLLSDNSFQQTKNTYLGILQGNLPTTFDLAPTYAAYKKIKDCVESLANSYNSFDFAIAVSINSATNIMSRYLNLYYPRQGVDNTNLNFSYPGNIKKLEKSKDGKKMVNEVAMRGQGSGVNQTVVVVSDTSSIQAYSQRQDVDQQADVPDTATLQSLGDEFIRINKQPMDLPTIILDGKQDPQLGSYGIGDELFINIVSGAPIMDFTDIYRIEEIDSTINDDDMEEISIVLSLA